MRKNSLMLPGKGERVADVDRALHIPGGADTRHLEDVGQDGAVELLDLPVAAILEGPVQTEAFGDHLGDFGFARAGEPEGHELELVRTPSSNASDASRRESLPPLRRI